MIKSKVIAFSMCVGLVALPIATAIANDVPLVENTKIEDKIIENIVKKDTDVIFNINKVSEKKESTKDLLMSDSMVPNSNILVPADNVSDYLYINVKPEDNSDYSGKLFKGQVADIIYKTNDWYKVKSGEVVGYVKADNVVTGTEAENLADKAAKSVATTVSNVKILSKADDSATVVTDVPEDKNLNVLGQENGFLKVSLSNDNNVQGYVKSDYLLVSKEFKFAISKTEDQKIEKEKAEAEKKAAEEKAAAEKKAAEEKAAAEKKATEQKAAAEKKAAEQKAAAEKKAAEQKVAAENKDNKKSNPQPEIKKASAVKVDAITSTSATRQAIINAAMAQIGVRQDCTMLVTNALKSVGINFHSAPAGYKSLGTIIPYDQAQAGDLVYYANGGVGLPHIAVYAGNGKAVHGGWSGNTVLQSVLPQFNPVFIRVR